MKPNCIYQSSPVFGSHAITADLRFTAQSRRTPSQTTTVNALHPEHPELRSGRNTRIQRRRNSKCERLARLQRIYYAVVP